ncbi:ferritin-like domain-containing protein [Ferrimicrobium sp.]|uniref:ferritin-like domain-containing protein n=1 Tax=Ferrimicrobium sp. TaxID=2926050 RepID=UPI002629314A|nr:ferritin-like domain-containing protein [Ferrimicrobium sp.]
MTKEAFDPRPFNELIEQSSDLQSDTMKDARHGLEEAVELGHELRSRGELDREEAQAVAEERRSMLRTGLFGAGALAAAGFGAALLTLESTPAFASTPTDVQILQSNASIEVLAVNTYKTALTLPYIGGSSANGVIKAFAETTMSQHAQHLSAFNAAVKSLGGTPQNSADPALVPAVKAAVAKITGPEGVIALALELEQAAAETYVKATGVITTTSARTLTASVMGVEAQHAAILLAVGALLKANAPQLIALPPNASALPAAAGSVGFPDAFYPTAGARPLTEGAVK